MNTVGCVYALGEKKTLMSKTQKVNAIKEKIDNFVYIEMKSEVKK